MLDPGVTFQKVAAPSYNAAVGDKRQPTAYVVMVRGVEVGTVGTRSEPNMIKPKGLRYTTGQRGFSRYWWATTLAGDRVTRIAYSREAAVEQLLAEVNR